MSEEIDHGAITPEITAEKAPQDVAVAQDKPADAPVPEVAPKAEAPVAAQDEPAEAPEAVSEDAGQVSNPNALRGVPAGPLPHPRTV